MTSPNGADSRPRLRLRFWQRLWFKLAVFGAFGAATTHVAHLLLANTSSARSLAQQIVQQGQIYTDLITRQTKDRVLAGDAVRVQELVDRVAHAPGVAFCLIQRGNAVFASSFADGTPRGLLRLPVARPVLVRYGAKNVLLLSRRFSDTPAIVRIGLELDGIHAARKELSTALGTIALGVIVLCLLAAFFVGRQIATPVTVMAQALRTTDPAQPPAPLDVGAGGEIGWLAAEVDSMRGRLHAAHLDRQREHTKHAQTERLAALGTLVAGVAHEINNPLTGMKNCQRRLAKGALAPERHAEYLQILDTGISRIERVVRQMLDFARPRSGERARTTLGSIVAETLALLEPTLAPYEVVVELGEVALAEIEVDAGQIAQLLTNVLLNAAYVTPANGRMVLGGARRDACIGLSVHDEGPGIAPEAWSRIFDPFFTTKPEGEGTGLGLSVSRTIAEAHGGRLEVECPAGGGTTVTLWLPARPEAAA